MVAAFMEGKAGPGPDGVEKEPVVAAMEGFDMTVAFMRMKQKEGSSTQEAGVRLGETSCGCASTLYSSSRNEL
jgi:hypothetical protein